jgi:hypothetical protein
VKLYLSLAHRIGAKPYGSNNNLVSISNHVPNINYEVWGLASSKPEASAHLLADHSCGRLAVHDRKGPVAYSQERFEHLGGLLLRNEALQTPCLCLFDPFFPS